MIIVSSLDNPNEKFLPLLLVAKTLKEFGARAIILIMNDYKNYTPVLVDDIISTGRTMIEAILALEKIHMKPAVCVGVHAVFASRAYEDLLKTGARVLTCNTIAHQSNVIDLSAEILTLV